MAHRAHKVGLSLPGRFLLLGQGESRGLDGFRVHNLSGRKVLEDVILNLEQVDGQFFVQRLSEFLREVDQEVQHVMLFVCQQNALLEATLAALQALIGTVVVLWDLQELFKQYDDKLNHLLVLLRPLFFLENLVNVHYESFNYFWRQEVLLVRVELPEEINLDPALAVLVGQLSQLTEEHKAEEGHLLVLVMENMQRQEILLKEVPFAEGLPDKWLTLPVKFDLLEELLETLFAVLMLDVDIQSSDLLNTADALDPEQQLGLLLRLVLISHTLGLVSQDITFRVDPGVADVIVIHPLIALNHLISALSNSTSSFRLRLL